MGRIAWGRVILGGIVAGVLFNAFEFLLHGRMLGVAWHSAMLALGKTPEEIAASQATSMLILLLWAFLACLFGVWLYAAIRPRFGAGPKTALLAAIATWFGVTLLPAMVTVAFDLYPSGLVTAWVTGELVGLVVSIIIGAWFYREA
jgi:hypothetical protein